MKLDDYMNRGLVMQTADDKLLYYISSASRHLMLADHYQTLGEYYYDKRRGEEWRGMARLYRQLCQADLNAAKSLIWDLEYDELISIDDWSTIRDWLVWFGFPAEDRL